MPDRAPASLTDEEILAELDAQLAASKLDPAKQVLLRGAFRGFLSMSKTPGGRALLKWMESTPPEERARLLSPEFQTEYRERTARFFESAPDEDLLKIARDAGLDPDSSRDVRRSVVSRKARDATARRVRSAEVSGAPGGDEVQRRFASRGLAPLSDAERAQLTRAFRHAGWRLDSAMDEMKRGGIEKAAELVVEALLPTGPLMTRPPPQSESFGKKNRSEILLPSDRRHCQASGCPKVVGNRSRYCAVHKKEAIQLGDTQRKRRVSARRKLIQTTERASRGTDEAASMVDTLPEEFAPILAKKRVLRVAR